MPHVILKDYSHHWQNILTKYEGKGTSKIPIFKRFSELGKTWKLSLGFSKILILIFFYELEKTWKYTDQDFKIQF